MGRPAATGGGWKRRGTGPRPCFSSTNALGPLRGYCVPAQPGVTPGCSTPLRRPVTSYVRGVILPAAARSGTHPSGRQSARPEPYEGRPRPRRCAPCGRGRPTHGLVPGPDLAQRPSPRTKSAMTRGWRLPRTRPGLPATTWGRGRAGRRRRYRGTRVPAGSRCAPADSAAGRVDPSGERSVRCRQGPQRSGQSAPAVGTDAPRLRPRVAQPPTALVAADTPVGQQTQPTSGDLSVFPRRAADRRAQGSERRVRAREEREVDGVGAGATDALVVDLSAAGAGHPVTSRARADANAGPSLSRTVPPCRPPCPTYLVRRRTLRVRTTPVPVSIRGTRRSRVRS